MAATRVASIFFAPAGLGPLITTGDTSCSNCKPFITFGSRQFVGADAKLLIREIRRTLPSKGDRANAALNSQNAVEMVRDLLCLTKQSVRTTCALANWSRLARSSPYPAFP